MQIKEFGAACAVVFTFATVSLPVLAYQKCEKYEYAELKAMSTKQLIEEYCKSWDRSRSAQRENIEHLFDDDERVGTRAMHDRDDCWDMMDKINRQPRFKNVKHPCPQLEGKDIDPLDSLTKKAKSDLEKARRVQ